MTKTHDAGIQAAWRFPFATSERLTLSRRQWLLLIAVIAAMHVAALSVARLTGTFIDHPNKDHTPAMQQVLERGYPVQINVPPGFAYYLALKTTVTGALGLPYWTGKYFLDVLLVLASGVLSVLLGFRLTRNTRIAVLSALCLVCAPIYILGVGMEEAAIFFLPVLLAALLLVTGVLQRPGAPRAGMLFVAGALIGLSALIRGNSQFIIVALAVVAALLYRAQPAGRRMLRFVLFLSVFAAGQAAAMLPWTLLQRSTGKEGLGSMPTMYQSYFDGFKRHAGNRVVDELMQEYDKPERSMKGVIDFNLGWLRKDPAALLSLYGLKFVRAWYMSDSRRWDMPTLLLHLPIWILALIGLARWRRVARGDAAYVLLLAVILYWWTVSAVMGGIARYSASLYGLIGIFCGVALLPALEWITVKVHSRP